MEFESNAKNRGLGDIIFLMRIPVSISAQKKPHVISTI
jgi:hypothetical protein